MKFSGLVLSLCLLCLAGCANKSTSGGRYFGPDSALTLSSGWALQDAAKVSDAAEAVSQPGFATTGWYKATVPGTVLTTLVNEGVYPEPLYGENNRPDKIPESLCRTNYWYRNVFIAPPRTGDRHTWLNFDGINYIADVWVNGHQAGTIKGAFSRGMFDISDLVTPGQPAAVAVLIHPPPHPGNPKEQTQQAGTGGNGGILAEDGATFLCSIGWDWIPAIRDRNVGIWQKVTVSDSGPVRIENPLVTTDLPLPKIDSADITVNATVHNVTDQPFSGRLSGSIDNVSFNASVELKAQESRLVTFTPTDTPQLHFANPKLWWPNTYGPQNLYTLKLQVVDSRALGAAVTPETLASASDEREVSFGIRKITYKVPDSENLTIVCNGVPIICKGGDWGMDEAMKRIPRERLEAQIHLHQLANYTMIRNWVGQSTEEDFYDLCDRYGILIWDEFFQPNPSDGPNPLDGDMYIANVREKVLRYRNHPSIALWCGRNEGNPPDNINAGITKIMAEFEPSRLYQHNSNDGRGVKSGGPYSWRPPVQYYSYNAAETFKTELGSVSIPTLEAVHAMMPQKDWDTFNDDWAEHDLCKGAQFGNGLPPYWQVIGERYGTISNLDTFVREAQMANYESYRAMYEGRFAKLFKPVTGVLTWMSNPSQPSMVWQLYSYDLEPNASLFAVRKACEPLHVQMNQNDFHVMVVNATNNPRDSMHARVRILNEDATVQYDKDLPVSAAANGSTDLGVIEWPAGLSTVHFIRLDLRDEDNKPISDNFYWRTTKLIPPPATQPAGGRAATTPAATRPATPPAGAPGGGRGRGNRPAAPREDFTALQSLPPATVDLTVARHDEGDQCELEATITNSGKSIALLTHLQLRKDKSNDRVLPVYYSDNYVSLLPGESRTISIRAAIKDLGGQSPHMAMDGWNIASPAQAGVIGIDSRTVAAR